MNDAAVGRLLLPIVECHVCKLFFRFLFCFSIPSPIWLRLQEAVHVKYLTPPCSPECFPRVSSSHSTPSHSPAVPLTFPTYRIVHRAPLKDLRWPTEYAVFIAGRTLTRSPAGRKVRGCPRNEPIKSLPRLVSYRTIRTLVSITDQSQCGNRSIFKVKS